MPPAQLGSGGERFLGAASQVGAAEVVKETYTCSVGFHMRRMTGTTYTTGLVTQEIAGPQMFFMFQVRHPRGRGRLPRHWIGKAAL